MQVPPDESILYKKGILSQHIHIDSRNPEYSRTSSFGRLLLLVAFVERYHARMVSPYIVKILDLVYPNDPVLTGESLLQCA